ncbi:MAG: sigma-70 family RNA polymerase sigma factor [Planctomycetota bacterium]
MSDNDLWERWMDGYGPGLLLYARQWVKSVPEAEDLVQEAFVRFWSTGRWRDLDPKMHLYLYLKRAALDRIRSRTRREAREEIAAARPIPEEGLFETTAERAEWRRMAAEALGELPEEQREVIVLKVWGGLTFPEIGEVAGVPANTAASRCRYALAALREKLVEKVS